MQEENVQEENVQCLKDYGKDCGNKSVPKIFDQFICSCLVVPLINSSKYCIYKYVHSIEK